MPLAIGTKMVTEDGRMFTVIGFGGQVDTIIAQDGYVDPEHVTLGRLSTDALVAVAEAVAEDDGDDMTDPGDPDADEVGATSGGGSSDDGGDEDPAAEGAAPTA